MRIQKPGILTVGVLALVLTSLGVVPGAAAQAPQGPRFGENYLLPPLTSARARDVPGLAVNPENQNHIVEAESDPLNLQCDYNVSFDGGRTWSGGHLTLARAGEDPPMPAPACNQNFDSGGYHHFNTGIVFGSGQNVYITFSIHRGPFNRPESNLRGGAGDDAVVARSTDGGRTFQPAVIAVPGGGPVDLKLDEPGLAGRGMRPQIAVERGAGTGGQDRLYVNSWECVRSSGGCSGGGGERRFLVARSDDGGANWNAPVLASRGNVRSGAAAVTAGSADEQAREPSQPVVGPDGAIYFAGRNRDTNGGTTCAPLPANCIAIYRSTDGGESWEQFGTGFVGSHPRLAIDPSTPDGVGTLYVAYQRSVTGPPPDANDIALQESTDRGQTWSQPVRVNDDRPGTNQTNAWPSVGPNGRVDVTWRDSRHVYPGFEPPAFRGMADIYMASSTSGGATFGPNRRVTDRHINLATGRFGDFGTYTWYGPVSLPLADGSVLSAWPDSRLGNFETGYQDVLLARSDPSAPVGRRTIATATPAGLSVRLSQLTWPGGNEAVGALDPATRVVVAAEDDLPAALAGAPLARANFGPLLLSPPGGLPAFVKSESARMRPEGAFVLGDTARLSPGVSGALSDTTRDRENVQRVAEPASTSNANRPAELARRVAELMRPLPGANPEAVIVNPDSQEAAAASALAAALKLPMLFVADAGAVPGPTSIAIRELGIKRLLIVGGSSVNRNVEGALATAVGGPANVKRLGGANPEEVSEAVIGESRLRGLPANVVYVADPARPVEAAALGAAVGRLGGLMLLRAGADTDAAEQAIAAPLPGLDPALVDRIVGAIGTGGSDPPVAEAAPQTPIGFPLPPARVTIAGCPPARAARSVISLSNASDRRNGTPLGDLIFAGAGDDIVDALAGDDCVDLGPGTDRGEGGSGRDFLVGGLGNDLLSGSAGNDRLRGDPGNDRIVGGTGNDSVLGGTGIDRIFGGFGNDRLHGQSGSDRISASRGRDRVNGGSGPDRITGGSSPDRISGDADSDRIDGGSSSDVLKGNSGNDRITGRTGNDRISGGSGNDRISARDGTRDRIDCGLGRDSVTADRKDRVARNCERVRRR